MKLHLDNAVGEFRISGYHAGTIVVNDTSYAGPLIVRVADEPQPWAAAVLEQVTPELIDPLLAPRPEVVLLGTGDRQQFPDFTVMSAFAAAGIGIEVMDTRAACRTFNILAAEGRQVLAALLPLGGD